MLILRGAFVLFLSLAVGYVLCILAKRQEGVLKTVGYTLGTAIIVLSLVYGVTESVMRPGMMGKSICGSKAMKGYNANFMRGHHK